MADVEHSVLTGTDLHEPKGVATAAANKVYLSNGTGSGTWSTIPAAAIDAAGVKVFQSQLYHIRDERVSGTTAPALTNNTWNTRTLNTEKTDELTINLAGNQFALAAGTYYCEGVAPIWFNTHGGTNITFGINAQARLRNVTDGTTALVGPGIIHQVQHQGSSAQGNVETVLMVPISGRFTIAGAKTFELQTWSLDIGAGPTFRRAGCTVNSGENEVFADLLIWKTA